MSSKLNHTEKKPDFALIGAGAAGTALALALKRSGYKINAVTSRSLASARRCAERLDSPIATDDAPAIVDTAEIIIIATPDGAIREVCDQLANASVLRQEQIILHLSGALSADVLNSAHDYGVYTLSLHPIQALSDPEKGADLLTNGSYFCLEGDHQAIARLQPVIKSMNGHTLTIQAENKARYHAALCIASNYLVSLEAIVLKILESSGINQLHALPAIMPLIAGSVENLRHSGIPNAITGPISRGDWQTLERHLKSLEALPPEIAEVYRLLGRQTIPLGVGKGGLSSETAARINQLLQPGGE